MTSTMHYLFSGTEKIARDTSSTVLYWKSCQPWFSIHSAFFILFLSDSTQHAVLAYLFLLIGWMRLVLKGVLEMPCLNELLIWGLNMPSFMLLDFHSSSLICATCVTTLYLFNKVEQQYDFLSSDQLAAIWFSFFRPSCICKIQGRRWL
jgi:hypothetical protein